MQLTQVAPNKRWDAIKDLVAPFPSTDSKTFGYWFNYLWEEARQVGAQQKDKQADLVKAFFKVLHIFRLGDRPTPAEGLPSMSNKEKRDVLDKLLEIGFKRVSITSQVSQPGNSGASTKLLTLAAPEIFKNQMVYTKGLGGSARMTLGFRADSRSYEDLVKQNGLKARARSKGQDVYGAFGLDQQWNPFSQAGCFNAMFLRRGKNQDNCLHTVVSVAKEFAEIMPYPLLSDRSLFPWANTPFDKWTKEIEQQALAHKFNVTAVHKTPTGPIDHLESQIQIYVLSVEQATAYDTAAWQKKKGVENPFPEAAVNEVGITQVLASVKVTRKHFFNTDDLQFYDFEVEEQKLLPSEEFLKQTYGENFTEVLTQKLDSLKQGAKNTWQQALNLYEKKNQAPLASKATTSKVHCDKCNKDFTPMQFKNPVFHPCATL